MKTKILIIEDNYYKYFTTKQVLESQLRLAVRTVSCETSQQLVEKTASMEPDVIMFRPNGGVTELLDKMKKRNTNRRNAEITLVIAQDVDDDFARQFQDALAQLSRRVANAA